MKISNILCYIVLALMITSCVTSKPDCTYISDADYNQRITISNPHYRKKTNAIGITFNIATTAAGAYAGYENLPLIKYRNGDNFESYKPANAVIGAAVGFSLGYLLNHWAGNNKKVDQNDPNKWIKKANKEFRLLKKDNNSIVVIHKNIEPRFQVKNFTDFIDFETLFPNSKRKEEIIAECAGIGMSRNELKFIIDENPKSDKTLALKKEYIIISDNLDDLFAADKLFPEAKIDIEEYSVNHVKNIKNLKDFNNRFPDSKHTNKLTDKIMSVSSFKEIEQFLSEYENFPNINSAKFWCIKKAPSITVMKAKYEKYENTLPESNFHECAYKLIGIDNEKAIEFSKNITRSKFKKEMETGEIYIGELKNNKREGFGFLIEDDKVSYRGEWKNDLKNGFGIKFFDDNSFYKGNFVDDYYNGFGEYKNEWTKEHYIGSFKNDRFNGDGTLTFETTKTGVSCTVKGKFIDNKIEGQGRADFSNGEWYEGEFSNGWPHGNGTFRFKDGLRLTGRYNKGNRIGKHTYRKFVLFGLVDTERGEVDYGDGTQDPTIIETFNINKKSRNEESSESKSCIKKFEEAEDWDELKFKFSGYDYKVFASNMVYRIECEYKKGYFVMLAQDTEAKGFWDSNWKKGWYFYEHGFLFDSKSGPFKTLSEAKKKTCDCN